MGTNQSVSAYIDERIPENEFCTYVLCADRTANICELLKEADGELNVGLLKKRYEEKFGRAPFSKGLKMKKGLEELSITGRFELKIKCEGQHNCGSLS